VGAWRDDASGPIQARWAALAKCSPDTALRDISDLLARGVLLKTEG
jgi:Fic family protein